MAENAIIWRMNPPKTAQSAIVDKIRKTIDSANVNFLIGSGLSRPFLGVLNDIETYLSEDHTPAEKLEKKKEYFTTVMVDNLKIVDEVADATKNKENVLANYKKFYRVLNNILLKRENSILTKQVNIFTTNIDIFSEKALEETGIEFNDGFNGRFNPVFNLGNFKKSYYKKSLHYENTSEIPVFNILKIHGSLTWKHGLEKDKILLDKELSLVRNVSANLTTHFENTYKELLIVNPTKEKFEDTLLNQYYYDLLRIYSNELEKENSVLFVLGFSFADEHIRDLTERVAASNPTLKIYIVAHSAPSDIYIKLRDEAKNRNIEIILPEEEKHYDFETINKEIFEEVIKYQEEVDDTEEKEDMVVADDENK